MFSFWQWLNFVVRYFSMHVLLKILTTILHLLWNCTHERHQYVFNYYSYFNLNNVINCKILRDKTVTATYCVLTFWLLDSQLPVLKMTCLVFVYLYRYKTDLRISFNENIRAIIRWDLSMDNEPHIKQSRVKI